MNNIYYNLLYIIHYMSLFLVSDIDNVFINFISDDMIQNMCQVNKYYKELLQNKFSNYYYFFSNLDKFKSPPNLSLIYYYKLFAKSVVFGDIQICKYILNHNKFDKKNHNNYMFRWSCYYAKLDIAKLLILKILDIDINDGKDAAFRWTCCSLSFSNNYDVSDDKKREGILKWLLSINNKINIYAERSFAFRSAWQFRHFNIIKLLHSIDNDIFMKTCNLDYVFQYEYECYAYIKSLTKN